MKTLNKTALLALFLFSALFSAAQSSPSIDGQNCKGGSLEWPEDADVVDSGDPGGIPGTSDINRMWATTNNDTLFMAFTRDLSVIGDAGFAFHFNTDCDSTSGDASFKGADLAIFVTVRSNAIYSTEVYEWTSAAGGKYTKNSTTFLAAVGDSTCGSTNYNFFELAIAMGDMVDMCSIGSCGGVRMAGATTYAGLSFNSITKDDVDANLFIFMNDLPEANVSLPSATLCSGDMLELDATGSSQNSSGSAGQDMITSYEWDLDYNGTFSMDVMGSTYSQSRTQLSGMSNENIALVVTDKYGCTDTTTTSVSIYANPTLSATYSVDDTPIRCQEWDWTYSIASSSDHAGNPLSSFDWYFPDGDSAQGSIAVHQYNNCFYTIAGNREVDVIGTDANGCSALISLTEPLPVEFVKVEAELIDAENVRISWTTASELNNERFDIQRLVEGQTEFETIGTVRGAGTTEDLISYEYVDLTNNWSSARAYYRVVQVDYDGTHSSSEVVSVENLTQITISAYPNPASDYIKIQAPLGYELAQIVIMNSQGVQVFEGTFDGSLSVQTSDFTNGFYYMNVTSNGRSATKKFQVFN